MAEAKPAYRRVVLTGFMGAGKTTVGRLLAPLLGWRFMDADHVLTERKGLLIPALFERHGEAGFRVLEAEVIGSLLTETETVLALGGGALEHAETRQRVARDAHALHVYLATPLETSLSRCMGESGAEARPLLRDLLRNTAALQQRFEARIAAYSEAQLHLRTEHSDPRSLAQAIAEKVRSGA